MAVASSSSEKESDIQELQTMVNQLTIKLQALETVQQRRYREQTKVTPPLRLLQNRQDKLQSRHFT